MSQNKKTSRQTLNILGAEIDALTWNDALNRISEWALPRESRYVCICNVHSVVTAEKMPAFAQAVNAADMATPDGAPVAWRLRMAGFKSQERINGPDLMWKQLERAQSEGLIVSFYGAHEDTLQTLKQKVQASFPRLKIGVMISPPYRELSADEQQVFIDQINQVGTAVLYVGLGCPKQEIWMSKMQGRIQAVMVGVGAAFSYHAGTIKRAPLWMQRNGLEWLHRLMSEPRRLWKRYFTTNRRYVIYLMGVWLRRS